MYLTGVNTSWTSVFPEHLRYLVLSKQPENSLRETHYKLQQTWQRMVFVFCQIESWDVSDCWTDRGKIVCYINQIWLINNLSAILIFVNAAYQWWWKKMSEQMNSSDISIFSEVSFIVQNRGNGLKFNADIPTSQETVTPRQKTKTWLQLKCVFVMLYIMSNSFLLLDHLKIW